MGVGPRKNGALGVRGSLGLKGPKVTKMMVGGLSPDLPPIAPADDMLWPWL